MELITFIIFSPLKPEGISGCFFGSLLFYLDSDWYTIIRNSFRGSTVHGTAHNRTLPSPMQLSREMLPEVVAYYSLRREHEEESAGKARVVCFSKEMAYTWKPCSRREWKIFNNRMNSTRSGEYRRSTQMRQEDLVSHSGSYWPCLGVHPTIHGTLPGKAFKQRRLRQWPHLICAL